MYLLVTYALLVVVLRPIGFGTVLHDDAEIASEFGTPTARTALSALTGATAGATRLTVPPPLEWLHTGPDPVRRLRHLTA